MVAKLYRKARVRSVWLKILAILSFICFGLAALPTLTKAGELDHLPELKTSEYNFEAGGNTKSKFLIYMGDSLGMVDLGKKVQDAIKPYEKDLAGYFAPGELTKIINDINTKTKRDIIKGDLTDVKARQTLSVFGNELIGKIADRILEKQGVKDKSRRDLWVAKILAPYNKCNAKATNALYHSKHCLEALASAMVPNTGIALVYELSKSNLAGTLQTHDRPAFLDKQVDAYITCIKRIKDPTTQQVTDCAISSMKSGVLHASKVGLQKQVLPSVNNSKETYAKIESSVFPTFETCVSKVNSSSKDLVADFYGCIDNLVMNTGSQVVQYKVNNTDAITENFSKNEINKLSTESTQEFNSCMLDIKKKNIRVDGMLNTSICETRITNKITLKVINAQFADTAKSAGSSPKEIENIISKGQKILSSCWKSDMNESSRESCIRQSVIKFADTVAIISFDKAIPSDLKTKNEIKDQGLKDLQACLEKNLPQKPSTDSSLSKKLDNCKFDVTLKVAIRTAEDSLKDLGKDLPTDKLKELIDRIVHQKFKKCLGEKPSDKILDDCSNTLKITAAKEISELLFAVNVDNFVETNGGLNKLGLKPDEINSFKSNLTKNTNICIDNGKEARDVMPSINKCLKSSIKELALFLGSAQYNASTQSMYKDRKDTGDNLRLSFQTKLKNCLSEKDDSSFSISDYTSNIDKCSERVGKAVMLEVGTDQIDHNLNSYLADAPKQDNSQTRKSLREKLLGNFSQCLNASKDSAPCISAMKKDATKSIVLAYGQSQVKAQLLLAESPLKIKLIEDQYKACIDKATTDTELDECVKNFAIDFAKSLGEMKVLPLLKKTLGSEDYDRNKGQVDLLMGNYKKCLSDLTTVSMSDGFMEKLAVCTKGLETKTIGFVKSVMNNWMTSGEEDKISKSIKDEFSSFLPCLGMALPGGEPWSEMDDRKIESILKPVAILLGQYIDYDINVAKKSLNEILQTLAHELKNGDTEKAKREVINLLQKNGALDQLLKTMVRTNVVDAFKGISDKDVPLHLKDELTKRETINAIFDSEFGKRMRDKIMSEVVMPALTQGKELTGPELSKAQEAIKSDIIVELVNSPRFGTKLVDYSIEKQLKETGWFTKLIGKALYSGDAFVWSNLKTTHSGQAAEKYIKEKILIPKFKGQKISTKDEQQIMKQAEELVTQAVKRYSDEKIK